jgi:hypothetical protein
MMWTDDNEVNALIVDTFCEGELYETDGLYGEDWLIYQANVDSMSGISEEELEDCPF